MGSMGFLGAPFLIYGFWGFARGVCCTFRCAEALEMHWMDSKLQDQKCRVKTEGQNCFICIFLSLKIQSPSPAS